MKGHIFTIISVCALLSVPSCSDRMGMDTEPFDAPLVVEGWIEYGRTPVVMLTTGIEVSEQERGIFALMENVIRDAKVTIEHAGVVYPLSARLSDEYMLKNYYTTDVLRGELGGKYRLEIEWQGKKATAVTTIPAPGHIDSLYARPSSTADSLCTIQAIFHNDQPKPNYYKFFTWDKTRQNGYAPSFMGTFSDVDRTGEMEYSVQNYADYLSDGLDRLFFHKGDTVAVKLATMDEELFAFWREFDQNVLCVTFPAVTMFSNIRGNVEGALGYWAGYGIDEKEICLEDY